MDFTSPQAIARDLRKAQTENKALRDVLKELMGHWEKIPMWNAKEVNASVERAKAVLARVPQ
jgi:hypothetical protein